MCLADSSSNELLFLHPGSATYAKQFVQPSVKSYSLSIDEQEIPPK